jgi:hypothetical protein
MQVRSRDEGMNPRMCGPAQGLGSPHYIRLRRATQSGHSHLATFGGDGPDGGKIALRGDGKPGLDNIDAQRLELARQAYLLLQIHRTAGRLLAVTQGCIEDFYAVSFHAIPRRAILKTPRVETSRPKVKVIISMKT